MTIDSRLFDDLSRVAGGAVSILSSVGKQLGEGLKEQMGDKFSSSSFSAANDDINRLQGVVTKLRMEQEEMKQRIAALESMLGTSPKKPTAKKKTPTAPAKKALKSAPKKVAKKVAKKPAAKAKKRA